MIRVLIVDDSAVFRQVLARELSKANDIEVVGTAMDPYVARDKILSLKPDVLTLDLEMPRMDGLTFLNKLMRYHPLPIIVVSSLTAGGSHLALEAMEQGAVDVVCKPGSGFSASELCENLIAKIRIAAQAHCVKHEANHSGLVGARKTVLPRLGKTTHKILAIGASTGGTEAIHRVLQQLPVDTPGTLIVQHMPECFTTSFAERLNAQCQMKVQEAKKDDLVVSGLALLAPGDFHLTLKRNGANYYVDVKSGTPVHHQRPSVDVLFQSVAKHAGQNAVGVILTGMGVDGAAGLLAMRKAGAHTLAQDEDSCIVFGMPKEAIRRKAVDEVVSLADMPSAIMASLSAKIITT